jgi:hypothetical protein
VIVELNFVSAADSQYTGHANVLKQKNGRISLRKKRQTLSG